MTTPTDTLVLDTTLIAQWRSDGIDFGRTFAKEVRDEETHTTQPWDLDLEKWLKNMMPSSNSGRLFGAIVLGVIVAVAVIILLRKKFEAPAARVTLDPDDEDTIYGVDFAAALRTAEQEQNYVQCIRLRYLQLLRLLHDQQKIYWQPGKTSTQYVAEVGLEPFAALSKIFVSVRYGNYPAHQQLYDEMLALAQEVEQLMATTQERKEAES